MTSALLVVDVQPTFLTTDVMDHPHKIANLVEKHDLRPVFTRFKHTSGSNFDTELGWDTIHGTPRLPTAFQPHATIDNTFTKTGYTLNQADGVIDYLEENNIHNVYIAGLETDTAIYSAALTLFEKGYRPIVVSDLCWTPRGEQINKTFLNSLEAHIGSHNVKTHNQINP